MKGQKKMLWHYDGSIKIFERIVGKYRADTWAVSEQKAAQNIAFRYRKQYGLVSQTKVSLVDKPILMRGGSHHGL